MRGSDIDRKAPFRINNVLFISLNALLPVVRVIQGTKYAEGEERQERRAEGKEE